MTAKNTHVDTDALEYLFSQVWVSNFADESRFPGLIEAMAKAAEVLAKAKSTLTVDSFPEKNMEQTAAYLRELLED